MFNGKYFLWYNAEMSDEYHELHKPAENCFALLIISKAKKVSAGTRSISNELLFCYANLFLIITSSRSSCPGRGHASFVPLPIATNIATTWSAGR